MANRIVWFDVPVANLGRAMAATEQYGGKILKPKEDIGQHGYRTIVLDSEGTRIALHSE